MVLLALWIGGLTALGAVAAPTLFAALQAHDAAGGRALAGDVFGDMFVRAQHGAWMLALLLLIGFTARAAVGPRPRFLAIRMWTVTGMLAASLATALLIAPRIDAIRRSAHGAVASLPDADSQKAEFGWLHGLSTGLMALTIIAGLGVFWLEAADPH